MNQCVSRETKVQHASRQAGARTATTAARALKRHVVRPVSVPGFGRDLSARSRSLAAATGHANAPPSAGTM